MGEFSPGEDQTRGERRDRHGRVLSRYVYPGNTSWVSFRETSTHGRGGFLRSRREGYDLHWDAYFELDEKYNWGWEKESKKYEWEEGDFVYIPPYTTHQHFNADPMKPTRFITATSRLVKALGFDWWEQVENAPEYKKK